MIKSFGRDLKHGVLILQRNKVFAVVALLTLTLCIGANAAIFSLINAVLVRPLDYPQPDRLVVMFNSYPKVGIERTLNGAPDYLDRREATEVFEAVALAGHRSCDISDGAASLRARGLRVTPDYFSVFNPPALGRAFSQEDSQPGNDKVVILSHSLWQQLYAGQPSAIGKNIRINNESYQVVGVMPQGFYFVLSEVRLLIPFALTERWTSDRRRHNNFAYIFGRLQPGVTVEQAQAKIDAINRANFDRFPQFQERYTARGFNTIVVGLHEQMVLGIRSNLYLLQGGILVVLLIGCVNLANLMLVRATQRHSEVALRLALGAGRWTVGRQILAEGLILAIAGGALGLLVGLAISQSVLAFGMLNLPSNDIIYLDWNVLLFTFSVSLLTGLLLSAIPVIRAFKTDLQSAFQQTSRGGSGGLAGGWIRSFLIVAQVSLTFVLLICAGLLLVSLQKLWQVDPGFESQRLFTAHVSLRGDRYSEDSSGQAFVDRLLPKIRSLPGVEHATATSRLPLEGIDYSDAVTAEDKPLQPDEQPSMAVYSFVEPDYFRTMGIPVLKGRTFDERDHWETPCTAIIDQRLADFYWEGSDPLGRGIRRGTDRPFCRVIGVVGNVNMRSLDEEQPIGAIYFSHRQFRMPDLVLAIRTAGQPESILSAVRSEVQQIDPEAPVFDVHSMESRIGESLQGRQTPMLLLSVFAAVALILSSIGIYGVIAYSVNQKLREIGLKMALGASSSAILRQVMGRSLILVTVGLLIGVGAALAVSRILSGMLYEVNPGDPWTYALVALLVTGVGLAACLIPSMRATRVDPALVLRYE